MKIVLLISSLFAFVYSSSYSQTDTSYKYFLKTGKETTRDSAYSMIKFYKEGNLYHGTELYVRKGNIKSEGSYAQPNTKTPVGSFKNYNEDGKLNSVREYVDGKATEITYYYKTGNKKSWILYKEKENVQKGWDESGKEIKNFVVEREARFKGGMEGWRKFLEKHLNANIAAEAGAPEGDYTVEVRFIVNPEGYVTNVKAVSVPAKCKPCGAEAVRVISEGPQWEYAIQNNVPVNYQALQYVTFQVVEDKKKRKG